MENIGGKKAITICILRVLERYSDYDHPMRSGDIIRRVREDFGVDVSRNTVARSLSLLLELGYDNIVTFADDKRGAYISERTFDDMELRVLIDSVLSSPYVPQKAVEDLVKKIAGLSNTYFQNKLPHVYSSHAWYHQRRNNLFYNLEIIEEAIRTKRQIAFRYNNVGIDGSLTPARESFDRVHPYAAVCANGQYYLIANYKDYDNIRHCRIDRITQIDLLDMPSRPITEIEGFASGLDIAEYAREHLFMFGGEPERVVFHVLKSGIGNEITVKEIDDEYAEVIEPADQR